MHAPGRHAGAPCAFNLGLSACGKKRYREGDRSALVFDSYHQIRVVVAATLSQLANQFAGVADGRGVIVERRFSRRAMQPFTRAYRENVFGQLWLLPTTDSPAARSLPSKLRSEGFRRRRPMLRGLIFEALFPRSLVPPKPCAPEALCCSDFCLRPMIPRPRKSDRVRRLWRNCSGTMRQALDRSVPTRLTSTAPDAEKIRGATGIGKPRRRGALTNSVFQCPATAVSIFRNAIFDCILTACAACGRPS